MNTESIQKIFKTGSGVEFGLNILALNAGSSTLKSALFQLQKSGHVCIWKGVIDWGQGLEIASFFSTLSGKKKRQFATVNQVFQALLEEVLENHTIDLIGHRVVHGADFYSEPTRITQEVRKRLNHILHLAPLHLPFNLMGIDCVEKMCPKTPQFAVFDTAYHQSMTEAVRTYPIPKRFQDLGIKKYGFHGISHKYCTERAAQMIGEKGKTEKIITCHLGSGASIAASVDQHCFDTTMGFTPLDGLMMGSRSGSIDPGAILYLLEHEKISPKTLLKALNEESGLFAIAGKKDMRQILENAEKGSLRAKLAIEMYLHRIKCYIGAMVAAIDGVDALVFTGGIGENSPYIRQKACASLSHLGFEIDEKRNHSFKDALISKTQSTPFIFVIQTKEEYAIASALVSALYHS